MYKFSDFETRLILNKTFNIKYNVLNPIKFKVIHEITTNINKHIFLSHMRMSIREELGTA